ncbi:hypothetical protein [Streptomyces justiciae]|uniref:Gram-positive cocci surface proteins LPxTG domain-containing protein n=1 Tax=Streptomyces justiciae TaxID=2780140 RepID=A0ABU3LU11_9ACTN|nr:hypothetical protein [Streptomyces justiciae]MDT7842730.1 hypothetical protein [Streptomyces justiciae]
MTGWLRTVRTTGLLIALGAGGALLPYDAMASTADPTPGVHASGAASAPGVPGHGRPGPGGAATHTSRPTDDAATLVPDTDSPRRTASPRPSAAPPRHGQPVVPRTGPSRAGSSAGEGRERPGRQEENPGASETEAEASADAGADEDGEQQDSGVPDEGIADGGVTDEGAGRATDGAATVVPEATRQPVGQAVGQERPPTEPVLRILPLGSGLVLIGLGLGLALLGVRLRRG